MGTADGIHLSYPFPPAPFLSFIHLARVPVPQGMPIDQPLALKAIIII